MAVTHLLDTSIFSQPIKDKPVDGVLDRWSQLGDAAVCTSSICLAEVLQGLEVRGSEKYWRRYRELLEDRYAIHPFEAETAACFSHMHAAAQRGGKPKSTLDLMIAATAKQHGLIVATLNTKHFEDIKDVAVENWAKV